MEEKGFTEKIRRFKKALRTFEMELDAITGVDVETGKPLLFPIYEPCNHNIHSEPLPIPRGRDGERLPLALT